MLDREWLLCCPSPVFWLASSLHFVDLPKDYGTVRPRDVRPGPARPSITEHTRGGNIYVDFQERTCSGSCRRLQANVKTAGRRIESSSSLAIPIIHCGGVTRVLKGFLSRPIVRKVPCRFHILYLFVHSLNCISTISIPQKLARVIFDPVPFDPWVAFHEGFVCQSNCH